MKLLDLPPLILTLQLDEASADWFTRQRHRHFPPERNHLSAHVTLFHRLPPESRERVESDLRMATEPVAPFTIEVSGLRLLGHGVAYDLPSPEAEALRGQLASRWKDLLGPQDSQRIRPHITIQNKVEPAEARALRAELSAGFVPFTVRAEGLSLWEYRGGPWAHLRTLPFGKRKEAAEGTQTSLTC